MSHLHPSPDVRLKQIALARRRVLHEGGFATSPESGAAWIESSWRRCLARGHRPEQALGFDLVSSSQRRRVLDASQPLVQAAAPVLERLTRAIAGTRYFAVLTNHEGVVVDARGPIDRSDRRADLITRVGVDLSEASVGTTAIGAALAELQPVWLHRGEHFFDDTSCYSCAGAPLFGPEGDCVGMLDLTGIDAAERPELMHLAAQSARSIENALVLAQPHRLLLRLNWPGRLPGDDGDGLLCVDGEGWVVARNSVARQLMPSPVLRGTEAVAPRLHLSDLVAMPWETLFDAAGRAMPMELPLWSGLRLSALAAPAGAMVADQRRPTALPLRELETALIRKAVDEARGNVQQAAKALGISRATVYRKLGRKKPD